MQVACITELAYERDDEGSMVFANALTRALEGLCSFHSFRIDHYRGGVGSSQFSALGKMLQARRWLHKTQPDVVIHIPTGSASRNGVLKSAVLGRRSRGRVRVILGLQRPSSDPIHMRFVHSLWPDLLLTPDPEWCSELKQAGLAAGYIPGGVWTERFCSVSEDQKKALREKYGFCVDQPVILHVGHLKSSRNVQVLESVAQAGLGTVCLVVSTSTEEDRALGAQLEAGGVHIIREYLPKIEEVYQLADCYLFPCQSAFGCLASPLSVYEALASGLPVVSTRFGSLVRDFEDGDIAFIDSDDDIVHALEQMLHKPRRPSRDKILQYSWKAVAEELLAACRTALQTQR